jgi:hypothetical protein
MDASHVSWTMQWDCDFPPMVWTYRIENSESDPCKGSVVVTLLTSESERTLVSVSLATEAPPYEAYTRKGSNLRGNRGGLTGSLTLT